MGDYSPRSTQEWELREFIARTHGLAHVEVERVVSGPGLRNIYEYLCSSAAAVEAAKQQGQALITPQEVLEAAEPAGVIAKHGVRSSPDADELCCRALDLFLYALGAELGNLALRFLPRGGVMIAGGGIVRKLLTSIKDGRVAKAYLDKGQAAEAYEGIPLLALDVDGDLLGQLGAWQHAWQRLQEQQQQEQPAAVKASDGGSSSIKAGGGSHERPALLPVRAGLAVVSAAAIVLGGGLLAIKGMRRR